MCNEFKALQNKKALGTTSRIMLNIHSLLLYNTALHLIRQETGLFLLYQAQIMLSNTNLTYANDRYGTTLIIIFIHK